MSPYYQKLRASLGTELLLIPSVAAVIHDNQRRLLLQEKHDGSWSLPAGAIEPGERPVDAICREVLEETGFECLESEMIEVLGGPSWRHTYPNLDRVEYVIILFRCTVKPSRPFSDRSETKRIAYFSREEMPPLALPYDMDVLFGDPGSAKSRP